MENDTGGEGIKTHDEENQLVSDVAKNIAEHKEVTAIEKKITTVVVESESSQVSSSTLSTEPILFKEGSPLAANASPNKPVPPPAVEVKPQETHTTQVDVSKDPVNEPGQEESSPQQTPNQATTNTDTVLEEKDRKVEVESINEKIEETKVEKAEESKVEKVEERTVDKSEEPKEEKVEELKVETKIEKVEEPKVETVEEQKVEKAEEPKVEKVEEPKVEKVEEPKVEKVEEPKVEKVEEPKVEKVEEPKVEKVEEPKVEKVEEPKIEKVEEPKVESVEEPKVIEKTVKPEEPNPQLIQREPQAPRLDAPTAATETLHKELSPAHEREVVKPASVEVAPSPQPQIQKEEMAEIQEENIKNQLHEIIEEIDKEVSNEEDGVRSHTWKPKGHYEIKRTPIKYEEIVPISVPDVTVHEHQKTPSPPPKIEEEPPKEEQHALDPLKTLRSIVVNGEPLSPVEIPVGIPLLARILPKPESEDDEPREKIPLERLFTPATDAELLVPQKKKKAFASSCFYRPDHPTIDDQVELAHKISVSLVDENNKTSKGQNMYMKRKNRSSKWVHQAAQYDMEEVEEEKKPSMEKPALKLLLNPKGIQDYTAVQRHYEELMTTAEAAQQIARMEMSKEIASTMESPTGKGAALFAKRKKRMDKFIVDETNVQQPQPYNTNSIHEETTKSTEMVSSTQQSFSMSSTMQDAAHFDALMSAPLNGPNSLTAPKMGQPGHVQLPDLTQILTQPKLPEKTTTSSGRSSSKTTTSTRSRSADSKPHSKAKTAPGFASLYSQKPAEKVGANAKSVPGDTFQDSLLKLRPGTPPTYLVPDGTGHFIEKQTKAKTAEINSSTSSEVTANNEGGAIYKAEVKVVQKPSLPTTPLTDFPISSLPHHSILDQLEAAKEEEKRKSFNLAAKGWGTYNNFYTPVHLGTAV